MNRTKEAEYLLWCLCAYKTGCALEQTAYAVCLIMEDRTKLAHVTKGLYLDVAKKFHTSWQNVERNIRNVRDTIWDSGEREMLMEISSGKINKRPTNTELLQFLTDYLLEREDGRNFMDETAAYREPATVSVVERIMAPHKAANDRAEIAHLSLRLTKLEENNEVLKKTVQRLHDMIWDLIRKEKVGN